MRLGHRDIRCVGNTYTGPETRSGGRNILGDPWARLAGMGAPGLRASWGPAAAPANGPLRKVQRQVLVLWPQKMLHLQLKKCFRSMGKMEMQTDDTKCAAKGDERLKSISKKQGQEVSEISEANSGWGRADDHHDPRQSIWRDPAFGWRPDSWGSEYVQGQPCLATLKSERPCLQTPLLRGPVFLHGIFAIFEQDFLQLEGSWSTKGKEQNCSETSAEVPSLTGRRKSSVQGERETLHRVRGVKPDHQFTVWTPGGCAASPQAGWRQTAWSMDCRMWSERSWTILYPSATFVPGNKKAGTEAVRRQSDKQTSTAEEELCTVTFMGAQTGERAAHHPAPMGSEATWVPAGSGSAAMSYQHLWWAGTGRALERKSHYIRQHSCGVFKEHSCGKWDVGRDHPNALSTAVK